MKLHSLFTLACTVIALLCSNPSKSNHLVTPASPPENDAVLANLTTAIKSLLDGRKDFNLDAPAVTANGSGYTITGAATFFGISGVNVEAQMADATTVSSFKATFASNSDLDRRDQKNLTREVMDKWMPASLKDMLRIQSFSFGFNNNVVSQVNIIMMSAPWKIAGEVPFSVSDVVVEYIVTNPTDKKSRSMRAEISCNGNLGNGTMALKGVAADDRDEWNMKGEVGKLSVNDLFNSLGMQRPDALPANIWGFEMSNCTFTFQPFNKSCTFGATSSIGQAEFRFTSTNRKGSGHDFLLGFSPPQNFTFATLDPGLNILDQLKFKQSALVLSSDNQESNLSIFKAMGQTPKVGRGLTLMGQYDIHALSPELEKFMGQSNLLLLATISNRPADIKLQTTLQTNIKFDKNGNVVLKGITFTLAPAPGNFTISMGGNMDVKMNNDVLVFKSNIGVDVSNLAVKVDGMLQGTWNNPFGIAKNVQVSDLGLGFGVSFKTTPIPLPSLAFAGKLKVGDPSSPRFSGDVAVAVDPSNPINCMVDAGFNKIVLKDIVEACAPTAQIPAELKTTLLTATLEDVRFTVVPSPTGITLFEKKYEPGFLIAGNGSLANFKAQLKIGVAQDGIEVKAGIGALRYEPFFSLTGSGDAPDPYLHLVIKQPAQSGLTINGKATLLGITSETAMKISDNGFDLKMNGKLFTVFESNFNVTGKNIHSGGDYYIKAELKNDLFAFITQNASAEIDKATKKTQNDITAAQKVLTDEQNKINGLYTQVNNVRSTVQQERDRDCGRLRAAQASVENERQKVQKIQGDIDSRHREIATIDQRIKDRNNWVESGNVFEKISRGAEAIPFYTEQAALRTAAMATIAAYETAKGTANLALLAAREVVGGMGSLCEQTPIDADPRVAGLIATIETSKGVMEGAKQVMEGGKIVGVGTLGAAKWIVKNGNPLGVVNITEARFEGALNATDGGKISLQVKGSFAGNPLDTKFSFDFKDPKTTVEKWARSMVGVQ